MTYAHAADLMSSGKRLPGDCITILESLENGTILTIAVHRKSLNKGHVERNDFRLTGIPLKLLVGIKQGQPLYNGWIDGRCVPFAYQWKI